MKKMLLVDDEIFIFNFINRFLNKEYIIDHATNGKDGLSLYKKNNYDVIFTDFSMPIMDGEEMINEIRKTDKDTPIILMTGSDKKGIKNIPVIYKPFNLDEIKQTLQAIAE